MADSADHNPLAPSHLFGHVQDATYFELPRSVVEPDGHLEIPQPYAGSPLWGGYGSIEPLDLQLTKFMLLVLVAALLMVLLFTWFAGKVSGGERAKGPLANFLEAILLFIRNDVAKPDIGASHADRFVPFLWTMFFFILTCNLLGMIPWLGSPTGAFGATGGLALASFITVVGAGMREMGPVGWLKAHVPHVEIPFVLAIFLKPMIFALEMIGIGIKHFVLSLRLLANMMAGHLVIVVIMAFIAAAAQAPPNMVNYLWPGVTAASVLGAVGISLLELLVAFIQAFVFTKLTALFIGMALHPH